MPRIRSIGSFLLAALVGCGRGGGAPGAAVPAEIIEGHARLTRLAEGVYAIQRDEPLALAGNGNSLVVVGARYVVVVDAQFTREATLEHIALIRRVTDLPVRYVVNTHWHDDHLAGTQVYQDSFPGVRVVRHANTVDDLVTIGAPNRAGTATGAPPLADRFERLLALNLGIDSTPVSEAERASVTSALRIMRRYLAELPGFREVPVADTVRDRLVLRDGITPVAIAWYGCANTRGDLVVHLPAHGIVATGDLVVWPAPFAFNSYPAAWVGVLDTILALRPRVIVPGHGPVLRDAAYVTAVRAMLQSIIAQAQTAVGRGDSVRAAVRSIQLEPERLRMTGDEKWANYMFRSFFLQPAAARAVADLQPANRPSTDPGCPR